MNHSKPCNKESCTVCCTLGHDFMFFDDSNTSFVLDINDTRMVIKTPSNDESMKNHQGKLADNREAHRRYLKEKKEQERIEMLKKKEEQERDIIYFLNSKLKLMRSIGTQTERCVFQIFDENLREECIKSTGFYITFGQCRKYVLVYGNDSPSYEDIENEMFHLYDEQSLTITDFIYDVDDSDDDEDDPEGGYVGICFRAQNGTTRNFMFWEKFPDPVFERLIASCSSSCSSSYNSDDEYYRDSELENIEDEDDYYGPVYWI